MNILADTGELRIKNAAAIGERHRPRFGKIGELLRPDERRRRVALADTIMRFEAIALKVGVD